jgi:protein-tyrosine phosphatase
VREHKRLGQRVLIACGAGINRSTAFAVAVLREEEGLSLLDAFRAVKRQHREAMPHPPVWESLCSYYQEDVPIELLFRV